MLKAFDLSVGVFVRGLTSLDGMLTRASTHASSHGLDPTPLLNARLADDMHPLAVQVHWTSEGAVLAVHRLLGVTSTPPAPEAQSFEELHERINAAITYLNTVEPASLEAGLERALELPSRGGPKTFRGDRFLAEFALPNFFFHLTTAYNILRHQGVPLQKGDLIAM